VIAPTIETDRLVMRAPRLDDLEAMIALWGDPGVARYISGQPSTREQTWTRLLRYAGHWELLGFGYWTVEERASGAFAGEVGFADYRREITPSLDGVPELGWVLAPGAHGKGYATEAARAAIAWAAGRFAPSSTIACIITPDNAASIRVAEKCGFREVRRTVYQRAAVVVYERPLLLER
jgi:RimJ/RimL family protein N-acetyltransferase